MPGACVNCGVLHPPVDHDLIDTRLKLTDRDLCVYIRKWMKLGTRNLNQQIIHMLTYAASQMSAHDLEKETVGG